MSVITNAKWTDTIRIECVGRAHSFPAEMALALVETLNAAHRREEDFDVWMTEGNDGVIGWRCSVGEVMGAGATPHSAVMKCWEKLVK